MEIQIQILIHPDQCQHFPGCFKEDYSSLLMDLLDVPRPGDCLDLSCLGDHLVSIQHGYLFKPVLDADGDGSREMMIRIDQALWTPEEPWLMEVTDLGSEWLYLGEKDEILDIWSMTSSSPRRLQP